jgi:hypothetical protein
MEGIMTYPSLNFRRPSYQLPQDSEAGPAVSPPLGQSVYQLLPLPFPPRSKPGPPRPFLALRCARSRALNLSTSSFVCPSKRSGSGIGC